MKKRFGKKYFALFFLRTKNLLGCIDDDF